MEWYGWDNFVILNAFSSQNCKKKRTKNNCFQFAIHTCTEDYNMRAISDEFSLKDEQCKVSREKKINKNKDSTCLCIFVCFLVPQIQSQKVHTTANGAYVLHTKSVVEKLGLSEYFHISLH